jgi:hypothetical protein
MPRNRTRINHILVTIAVTNVIVINKLSSLILRHDCHVYLGDSHRLDTEQRPAYCLTGLFFSGHPSPNQA